MRGAEEHGAWSGFPLPRDMGVAASPALACPGPVGLRPLLPWPCCPAAGIEIANRGQIKFKRLSPSSCNITLIISYEVPNVLVPFANVRLHV